MSVVIGSRVTVPGGKPGVVVEHVSSLDGNRWKVRTKDGDPTPYRVAIYHESALSDVQPPTTYTVGDLVRIGAVGPHGTVTGITSGDPTLYEVTWKHLVVATGEQQTRTSDHVAADLVGQGE